MYIQQINASTITAILPEAYIQQTLDALKQEGHNIVHWPARGTLKDNRWYRGLFPAISPEKGVIRILVPNSEIEQAMQIIVEKGNLHRQGTGAVFSVPCDEVHIGGHFNSSCDASDITDAANNTALKENLDIIQCIVEKSQTEQISNAAIAAGAHGPIVHYCEGRGLRDRLGWLRITKQAEKEVLTVIVENADADNVFHAMANAGDLDLPGRGFMYQMPVNKGLFNLPSHFDAHRHNANMQQVIGAIDHLMGHDDWRDQSVFEIGGSVKTAGLGFLKKSRAQRTLENQVCLTAMVDREHAEQLMDMMLDSGAPGLNTSYCQRITADTESFHDKVKLVSEYGIINCIIDDNKAHEILAQVKIKAEQEGIENLCLFLQPIPKVITYIHHPQEEKRRNANERQSA